MPFVDINSIAPKVKPATATNDANTNAQSVTSDLGPGVKEMKGPEITAEPVTMGTLPGNFVNPTPVTDMPIDVQPISIAAEPIVQTEAPVNQVTIEPVQQPEVAEVTSVTPEEVTPIESTLMNEVVTTPTAQPVVEPAPVDSAVVLDYSIEPEVAAPVVATTPVSEAAPVVAPTAPVVEPVGIVSNVDVPVQTDLPTLESKKQPQANELAVQGMSLDEYLEKAIALGASDIHFTVGYRVYVRVNGDLQALPSPIITKEQTEEYAKLMFEHKGVKNYARIKDFDMAYQLGERGRFRLNIFRQQGVYGLVYRLIPSDIKTIDQLGLPPTVLDFAKLAYGLVLVTGPTGSGKSTTLAAIINYINQTQAKHVVTIEDPVEYVYPLGNSLIDQREITQDTDSWNDALKSVLRQDPDVVLVGELRDYETIAAAIRVAETGHLVFGTLHTNTAAQTIDRIIDVFPEHQQSQIRVQLANSLQGVISQRLIPLSDGSARKPAVELLVANDAVRSSIRDNKTHQIDNIIQTGAEFGMMTLEKSLVNLIRGGLISTEKAQEFTNKPDEIVALLRKA